MKKLVFIILAVFAFVACEKDPDLSKLDNDYLVFTTYDKKANFAPNMYYLPDSVMIIGDKEKPEYWKGEQAAPILDAFKTNMTKRGYTLATDRTDADFGLQVSYIASTYYFAGYNNYDNPYWWWGYPGYWGSGYWGNWSNWYYPYPVVYSYSTGAILTEMVNLNAEQGNDKNLPIVWNAYLGGLLTGSNKLDMTLTVRGINQAFVQSPYLKAAAN
ncbi:MAG: DUF4136 domain-containing protein [Bacteroides sp.]